MLSFLGFETAFDAAGHFHPVKCSLHGFHETSPAVSFLPLSHCLPGFSADFFLLIIPYGLLLPRVLSKVIFSFFCIHRLPGSHLQGSISLSTHRVRKNISSSIFQREKHQTDLGIIITKPSQRQWARKGKTNVSTCNKLNITEVVAPPGGW